MTQLTADVQHALLAAGFPPGPLDGDWGPLTRTAMQAFELKRHLPLTDLPTDTLLNALLGKPALAPIGWLDAAYRYQGLKEGPGAKNNPVIMDWADELDVYYPSDATAWCGLFVGWCIHEALPNEPLPGNPLGARQWERFGIACAPQLGAVATFWRESKASGKGHVGFVVGQRPDAWLILGGNTHNDVSTAWLGKDRSTGFFWPVSGPKPFGRPLPAGGAGVLSVNEA